MTQQEYENKTKDELEQSKRWKPKYKETYYYVEPDGDIACCGWMTTLYDRPFDDWHYLTGNCFKTVEEAEEYKNQIEYTARYKNYIEEHSEPIYWNNGFQIKYYAIVNCITGEIDTDVSNTWIKQGVIYASSKEIIRDAINEIGIDNFKKYVLGVK